MSVVTIRLQGDGIKRMLYAAEALGQKGRREFERGLQSGGLRTRTKVRKALPKQTSIKPGNINKRTSSQLRKAALQFVIIGSGKGVPIKEVRKVSGRVLRKRSSRNHPRDDRGRYKGWPHPGLGEGNVTATVWDDNRTFFASYKSRTRGLVYRRPGEVEKRVFGPSVSKEIVKDESAQAFHSGILLVQHDVHKRILKITGGFVS